MGTYKPTEALFLDNFMAKTNQSNHSTSFSPHFIHEHRAFSIVFPWFSIQSVVGFPLGGLGLRGADVTESPSEDLPVPTEVPKKL